MVISCVLWAVQGVVAASDLPMPGDTTPLPSARVVVGKIVHHEEAFQTALPMEAVRAFYRNHLSVLGWTERQVPSTGSVLGMERLLYAERGHERLLVEALAANGMTRVLLDRWGKERGGEGAGETALSGQETAGPFATERNICCSSEAVSDQESRLPSSFPVYPGARRMVSASPEAGRVVSEFFMSAAPAAGVLAYYQQMLEAQGWRAVPRRHPMAGIVAEESQHGAAGSLAYEHPTGLCAIGVSDGGRAAQDGGGGTIIMVSYIRREARPAVSWSRN
jgi:hypothetical protein